MRIDPFTHEMYEGNVVTCTCDGCGCMTEYEDDAYGLIFIVLCDKCRVGSDEEPAPFKHPNVYPDYGYTVIIGDYHD